MILNIRNGLLLLLIAIALAAAVLLATDRFPLLQGDAFQEDASYYSIPEFPFINEADNATIMEFTTAFLESSEWSEVDSEDWVLADVAPLTYRGSRIGVYAEVQFRSETPVSTPLDFVRCNQRETWVSPTGEFVLGGLHIWFLDGSVEPYNVLPLNSYGELPSMQEVASFVTDPADCPEPHEAI